MEQFEAELLAKKTKETESLRDIARRSVSPLWHSLFLGILFAGYFLKNKFDDVPYDFSLFLLVVIVASYVNFVGQMLNRRMDAISKLLDIEKKKTV